MLKSPVSVPVCVHCPGTNPMIYKYRIVHGCLYVPYFLNFSGSRTFTYTSKAAAVSCCIVCIEAYFILSRYLRCEWLISIQSMFQPPFVYFKCCCAGIVFYPLRFCEHLCSAVLLLYSSPSFNGTLSLISLCCFNGCIINHPVLLCQCL